MSDKQVISFDEYVSDQDIRFAEIDTPRGLVKLGSVSSADILDWIAENSDPNEKFAGLRLLAKSIINPDGSRIPVDKRTAAVEQLKKQDAFVNGHLVAACLELNGLNAKPADRKNDSSETKPDVSPSGSQAH